MNNYQKSYTAFMESVCNKFNCKEALPALNEGFKAFCEASYADELRSYARTGIDGYDVRKIFEDAGGKISRYHKVGSVTEFNAAFNRPNKPNPMADDIIDFTVSVYEAEGYGEIGGRFKPIKFSSLDECAGILDALKGMCGISNDNSDAQV